MRLSVALIYSVCLLVLVGCGSEAAPPIAERTAVPTSTPAAQAASSYDGISSMRLPNGYYALGEADAPITMVDYGSYDSPASRTAHDDIYLEALNRVRAGEVRYIFVPLSGTGPVPNGNRAAQAALCAGEQDAYWPYHDRLFAAQTAENAFSEDGLRLIAEGLSLDVDAWQVCLDDGRTGAVLEIAAEQGAQLESYSGTPTILLNDSYVLNEWFSINRIIEQMLVRVDDTGMVSALETVTPGPTDEPPIELGLTAGENYEPPIEIDLPPNWERTSSDILLLRDIDALRPFPYAVYKGPADGAVGTIVVLYGFPSVVAGNPMIEQFGLATPTPSLFTDGLRLLRLAVMEAGCNIGRDTERNYTIGELTGTGTEWSAVGCPQLADTRGWFVGTRVDDLNFLFYAFVEPIDPLGMTEPERGARDQMQSILDTVRFRVPDAPATDE